MLKRIFDILFSFFGLMFLTPLFLTISLIIWIDSPGEILYKQTRIGRNRKDFFLLKFRTMATGSDKKGLLTIGNNDSRVTRSGYYLRKYKLDELPQLINVLVGEMSLVGPRPEVAKFVDLYNEEQLQVLSVKPGITDYASIEYANENELLSSINNPEELYISEIMPAKLKLNLRYIRESGIITDIRIIFRTFLKIIG